jgi:archaellum biogenesis ATPase FlaH
MTSSLETVTAAQITPQTPKWAWAGRVPLGEITIVAGPPGQGKTQLMLGMCAQATRGKLSGDLTGPVDALYVSAEDSIEHTLTPRTIAAQAVLERVHFLRGTNHNIRQCDELAPGIAIPKDVPALDQWLSTHRARIVVLDPIVAMIPTTLNTHRDQDVRQALSPLARVAQKHGAAIVVVMHLNKNIEADALNRLSGSIGFGGAARSVLLFAADPDDPDGEAGNRRILAHVKCNVGAKQPSISYRIEPRTLSTSNGEVHTSIAMRDGNTHASANDLLAKPTSAGEATARTEAREFLEAELADGPVPTIDLKTRAEDAGLNWRTVERAKQQMAIRARKKGAGWVWELLIPNNPPVGLVVVDGLEGKADKADKAAGSNGVADLDPDELFARHRGAAA